MELETISDNVPCSCLGFVSGSRLASAGLLSGWCVGAYEAHNLGYIGVTRFPHMAYSMGGFGFRWGLYGAVFSSTRCGMQHYRWKDDWLNASIGGTAAGLAIDAGERKWKHAAGLAVNVGKRNWKFVANATLLSIMYHHTSKYFGVEPLTHIRVTANNL